MGEIIKRLENVDNVIYDANIIVYYCFLYNNHRIEEYTTKARKLTEFLINNGSIIVVPKFIVDEIKRKSILNIVKEYVFPPKNIIGLDKNPSYALFYRLNQKVNENFLNLLKDYFIVENYEPNEEDFILIKSFFMEFDDVEKMNNFLKLKNRSNPLPSNEDLKLILFSKYKNAPLISNDYDITFFVDVLLESNLAYDIFEFKSISYYN